MTTTFQLITEEFKAELKAISAMVKAFDDPNSLKTHGAKVRIAAANSATLLLAATFEEYAREMAREYARKVVRETKSLDHLPAKMIPTAWKHTLGGLAKMTVETGKRSSVLEKFLGNAQSRFAVVYEFCKGDLTQDIYKDLIHNDSNLRPSIINQLFSVSGLSNVCNSIAKEDELMEFFGVSEANHSSSRLDSAIHDFVDRRNEIAHSLDAGRSEGGIQILNDVDLYEKVANCLCRTLSVETEFVV